MDALPGMMTGENRRHKLYVWDCACASRSGVISYHWSDFIQLSMDGGPWYGVVGAKEAMYREHMVHSMHDNGRFRLKTRVAEAPVISL